MIAYPNLAGEIAKRGIKKKKIAQHIGICEKSLTNRLNGRVAFTWPEVRMICRGFFPDMEPEELFRPRDGWSAGMPGGR